MTFETFVALLASIEKWEQNARVKEVAEAKIFADDCPLCMLFNRWDVDENVNCEGCPVWAASGQSNCEGTPWEFVQDARACGDLPAFHRAARLEVEFLQSLLPPIWAS